MCDLHSASYTIGHSKKGSSKGVYPQSDESLATVDIDASKGFVDLWVHSFFMIFAIFELKRLLKLLEMAFNHVQTCLIFPFRWAGFPIKFGRNAQWEHLCSIYFDDFLPISLIFFISKSKSICDEKMISQWEQHIPAIISDERIPCNSARI